ncbi:MAG: hypothetical protein ACK4ZJ_16545 [Allorhizobium sp.]
MDIRQVWSHCATSKDTTEYVQKGRALATISERMVRTAAAAPAAAAAAAAAAAVVGGGASASCAGPDRVHLRLVPSRAASWRKNHRRPGARASG